MAATVCRSAVLVGARKHTAWKTFVTWHCANWSLAAISWPKDLAPTPLPGRVASQPSTELAPCRQRFAQLLSGVTKPCGKFAELIRYFGCTMFAVYTSLPAVAS